MNNPILTGLFAVAALTALIIFLWMVILPVTKDKLKPQDQDAGKFLISIFSLLIFGLIVHYGSHVVSFVLGSASPL